MKKRIVLLFYTLIGVLFITRIYANSRLIFYINPAPLQSIIDVNKELDINKINKINKKSPYNFIRKGLKNRLLRKRIQDIGGILALYNGYMNFSDKHGQISFPLMHEQKKVYLVVTTDIKLIKVKGNTVSHEEFMPNNKNQTDVYSFEKKKDLSGQFYWRVAKIKRPENNIISSLSVILITKPKNIYVAEGDFRTNDNKQIILPRNIYAINNNNNNIILNFINKNRFFEPIDIKSKKITDILYQNIITNN